MEQRPYLTMLFVLMAAQLTGVFYLIFNSPLTSYPADINSNEITQIIQKELRANLRQQENNGQKSITSVAIYEDNQVLHTALRNIVREELIVFFSNIQDNNISSTNKNSPTVELPNSDNKTRLTEMEEAVVETALTESRVIIDTAKADGIWTMENTMAISVHAFKLPITQRRELHKSLLNAVAQGEIKLAGAFPDF